MNEKQLGYGKSPGNPTALLLSVVFIIIWGFLTSTFTVRGEAEIYIPMLAVSAVFYFGVIKGLVPSWSVCEITITDKRVYGSVSGRQMDYPLFSITAVELSGKNDLTIHTASEKTTFYHIPNAPELQGVLRSLLIQGTGPVQTASPIPKFDELRQLKELLDSGILTQEEFDIKKKQILGL